MNIQEHLQNAVQFHRAGDSQNARSIYIDILKTNGEFAPAHHNLGILYHENKDFTKAYHHLRKAVELSQGSHDFVTSLCKHLLSIGEINKLASLLSDHSMGRIDLTVVRPFVDFLAKDTGSEVNQHFIDGIFVRRITERFQEKQYKEALIEARYLLDLLPNSSFGWKSCAAILLEQNNLEAAEFAAKKSIELSPLDAQAVNNLGNILRAQGKKYEAQVQYELAIKIDPTSTKSFTHLATILRESASLAAALEAATTAVSLDPNYALAWLTLGNIYYDLKNFRSAEKAFKRCILLDKAIWRGHLNLGVVYRALGYHEQAFEEYKKAHELQPRNLEVLNNIGILFIDGRRHTDAIVILKDALAISPESPDAWLNLGSAYRECGHYTAALHAIDKSIQLRPKWAAAHNNKGIVLMNSARHTEAEKEFIKGIEIDPNNQTMRSNLLFCANYNPELSPQGVFERYKNYLPKSKPYEVKKTIELKKKKIRLGYLSPDFKKCSAISFILPIIKNHDRRKFEVYCCGNVRVSDAETAKVKSLCDKYYHTYDLSDEELENLLIKNNLDVIIDLAGHTDGNRLESLRNHPARFQISTLGFGYTTGLDYIDFFMNHKDAFIDVADELYSEKILKLPELMPFDFPVSAGSVSQLPALKNSFLTFGCLSRGIRINNAVIEAWAKILKSTPGSRLIVNSKDFAHESECILLSNKFLKLGIEPDRLDIR
jgi:protein O-GlcNAc transferase